jgi:hypothetical protein
VLTVPDAPAVLADVPDVPKSELHGMWEIPAVCHFVRVAASVARCCPHHQPIARADVALPEGASHDADYTGHTRGKQSVLNLS